MEYSTTQKFVNGVTYTNTVIKNKDGWTRFKRTWQPGSLFELATYNTLKYISCHEDTWRVELPVSLNKHLSTEYLNHKLNTNTILEDIVLDCCFEEPFETVSIDQRIALSRCNFIPDFGFEQNIVTNYYCIPERYIDHIWEENKLFCKNCITNNLEQDKFFEIWTCCDIVRGHDLIDEVCCVYDNWCADCKTTALFTLADFEDDSNLPLTNYGITRKLQRILV